MTKKLSNKEVIDRIKEKYGDKYDYSKINYQGNNKKITLICKKHGDFEITFGNLMNGRGCPKCKFEKLSNLFKSNTDDFIKKAKKIHGGKYDYSKVEYVKNDVNVLIGCKKHGYFSQLPLNHLQGEGCPKCRYEKIAKNNTLTNEEYVKRCKLVHGDAYDYAKTNYQGTSKDVIVICPKHGEFTINAWNHLIGCGCQKCNSSHLENEIRQILKENNVEFEEQKKFDWLGKQSLDFYIPNKNIAIECQGRQHYQSVELFGGEEGLLKRKVLDDRKKRLCEENGINIIYYSNMNYADNIITDKESIIKLLKE